LTATLKTQMAQAEQLDIDIRANLKVLGYEWVEVSLGKYCKIQGGFAFSSKDFIEKGVPAAKIKNVKERDIDVTDCGFIEENLANANSDYFIKKEMS
jgi:hypothetical protein